MPKLLKTEFYKLFHSWYFWGIGLFNFLLSSVLLLDSNGETSNLFFASLFNTPLLYFLIIVFAALFVGDDLGGRTLLQYITAGHKRGHIFFAKALVYEVACIIILAFPLFIHELVSLLYLKETFIATDSAFNTIIMIVLSMLAMCILPFFVAFLFHDMGKTMAISMVLFFLMIFLMNGEQAQSIIRILPMGQLRLISLQQLLFTDINYITSSLLWSIILYFSVYLCFCRADLK